MIKKEDKLALERYIEKIKRIQESNNVNLYETPVEKNKRIQRCKSDYEFCVSYYFPHYATVKCASFHIDAANFIKKNKDCITAEIWARGHAKSTHLDIMTLFWLWINGEVDVALLVGKNADDAKVLLSDLQAEFEANPQIIADFGEQKRLGSWEDGNFVTKNGCAFFSLGRGQSPRGIRYRNKRPNIVIMDDIDDDEIAENPKRVKRVIRWIWGALYNAMDNKGKRLIIANNLISKTGIVAELKERIEALAKTKKNVRVRVINAVDKKGNPSWPEKYTKEYFKDLNQTIGDYAFQSEHMNNPQIEGKIFKREEIQWCVIPKLEDMQYIAAHWDVAYAGTKTADYNAVKIWGLKEKKFYCIKAFVKQCKMAEAIRFMIDYDRSLPEGASIEWRFESQFWNDALKMTLDEVQEEEDYQLNLIQCDRDVTNKYQRIIRQQPFYQNGKLYYNIDEKYSVDMEQGISQLLSIEPGYTTHDDSPDADEAAITYLNKHVPANTPLPLTGGRPAAKGAY